VGYALRSEMPDRAARERFAAVTKEQCGFVWRTLRRFGVGPSDADDAAQEVFLVLSKKIGSVAPGDEKWFLFHTAINMALRSRRSQARSREATDPVAIDSHVDPALGPEDTMARSEAIALLDRALSELPPELRTVFVLCDIEQITMADAARGLELPAGTVASRLRKAREMMTEAIARIRRGKP